MPRCASSARISSSVRSATVSIRCNSQDRSPLKRELWSPPIGLAHRLPLSRHTRTHSTTVLAANSNTAAALRRDRPPSTAEQPATANPANMVVPCMLAPSPACSLNHISSFSGIPYCDSFRPDTALGGEPGAVVWRREVQFGAERQDAVRVDVAHAAIVAELDQVEIDGLGDPRHPVDLAQIVRQ